MDLNGMTPTVYRLKETEVYVTTAADAIEVLLQNRLKERKFLRLAVSGGKSPLPVYRELAKRRSIPWERVNLFLVDERYVPLKSNDSNYKNLSEIFKGVRKFYHFNTRDPIEKIVDQYQKTLQQFDSPLFDLVLLGLGEDGHTASLFPHGDELNEKNRLVTQSFSPDINTQDRLTLTFPAILDSAKIVFLIQGASKKDVVDRWLRGGEEVENLPATAVLEHSDVSVYYDQSA